MAPVPGEDAVRAQLWVLDEHGGFCRHDLTSAGTGGTWDAQSSPVGHDQRFRKYLVQNFDAAPGVPLEAPSTILSLGKRPCLAPGTNTGGNMGTPNAESDRFDLEYTYVSSGVNYTVSGRSRTHNAASWDEMSLPKPPWPPYKWSWNTAISKHDKPHNAWLPFLTGPGRCQSSADRDLRMAFMNRGVPQTGYWTISWDDIVVEGTGAVRATLAQSHPCGCRARILRG